MSLGRKKDGDHDPVKKMKEEVSSKSSEKLLSDLKLIKATSAALIGILIMLYGVNIYGLFMIADKTVFIALMAVAIALTGMLPIQYGNMKKIKSELSYRGIDLD